MRESKFFHGSFKLVLLGLLNCFFVFSVYAQETRITGVITDSETNEPLIGVNIIEQGTENTNGTVTDLDGNYTIEIQSGASIMYSYIGYLPQTIASAGKSQISVKLAPDAKSLEELVVVGYGVMKRSDLTGSITSVGDVEIAKVKSHNAVEALQAKVAGMDLTSSDGRAGSNPSVNIRGSRTLSGNNSPLYIVDGVDFGSSININSNDIASMEVLKDASSTAIYGSRGANGVIMITTKKGAKGKANISFNVYKGITQPLGTLPYGDRNSYLKIKRDLQRISNYSETNDTWSMTDDQIDNQYLASSLFLEEQIGKAEGTNFIWPKEQLESNGTQESYHINISGGDANTSYSTSIENFIEDTYIEKDRYERFGFRTTLNSKVNKFLSVGNSTVLTHEKLDRGEGLNYSMSPLVTPYDEEGNLYGYPISTSPAENPYINMDSKYKTNQTLTTRVFSSFFADVKIIKGLSFRTNINTDLKFRRFGESENKHPLLDRQNSATNEFINNYKWTWSNVLTYDKTIDEDHHIMLTAANEVSEGFTERNYIYGTDLNTEHPYQEFGNWYNLPSAVGDIKLSNIDDPDSYYTGTQMESYIGRIHYGYKGRYLLQVSGRQDGASQLKDKWDFFPSASLAWRVSSENFMQPITHVISNLKVRFGVGTTGNQSIPAYSSFGGTTDYTLYANFGDNGVAGVRTGKISNEALRWEKTKNYNLGIDYGFLNNRISGSVDLYSARTTGVLQLRSLPPTSAIPYIADNIGETLNEGIEISLNTVNVKTKNFTWTTDFTFTKNNEEIVFLSEGVTEDKGNKWFVGQPLSVFYDLEKIGIWQLGEETEAAVYDANPGDIKFRDQLTEDLILNVDSDGDGVMDATDGIADSSDGIIDDNDKVVVGTPRPKWYGGITSNMSYKNFDFSVLVFARYGQTIEDDVMSNWNPDGLGNSMQIDYWTPNNPTDNYPSVDPGQTRSGWSQQSSLTYTDGSYIKIKDITLGYTLPTELTKKVFISSARIYVSAKNSIVFSKFFDKDRYDPEMSGSIGYPAPKIFLVGASIKF